MKTTSKKRILPVPVLLKLVNLIDKPFFKKNFNFMAPFYGWSSTVSTFYTKVLKTDIGQCSGQECPPTPQMSYFPELFFQTQGRNKL